MAKIIGIDPGITGAIAVIDDSELICVYDFPLIRAKKRNVLDPYALGLLFDTLLPGAAFCVFENVHAMPRDGKVQAFNFGHATGLAEGLIVASMIPIKMAEPGVWKTMMGLGRDKEKSRLKAIEYFPLSSQLFARKKDHNRAEAVMLALLGERYMQ